MKHTRNDLDHMVERLAKLTGEDLSIETWSPGDGWTRYRLIRGGDAYRTLTINYRKQEFGGALSMALTVAEMMDFCQP